MRPPAYLSREERYAGVFFCRIQRNRLFRPAAAVVRPEAAGVPSACVLFGFASRRFAQDKVGLYVGSPVFPGFVADAPQQYFRGKTSHTLGVDVHSGKGGGVETRLGGIVETQDQDVFGTADTHTPQRTDRIDCQKVVGTDEDLRQIRHLLQHHLRLVGVVGDTRRCFARRIIEDGIGADRLKSVEARRRDAGASALKKGLAVLHVSDEADCLFAPCLHLSEKGVDPFLIFHEQEIRGERLAAKRDGSIDHKIRKSQRGEHTAVIIVK